MIITDNKKLKDIQMEFNDKFSHLKIEFYTSGHKGGEGSPVEETLDHNLSIGKVRKIHNEGDLSIDGHQKVSTFEQNFYKTYGLSVQVFRKSGALWMQTTSTDDWTLAKQNRKGGHSEEIVNEEVA
ncbi:MAG: hypothetical protein NXI23_00380 [Bacteroidetes bacterium]|jgi:hypothetical protein|nr:hypothetical protein [Bacteroidota bacterium]MDF1867024.1 hypothetical protein [Saprospiraceae bacterium]